MPEKDTDLGIETEIFMDLSPKLKKGGDLIISGLPNTTTQSYFITLNPSTRNSVIFWLLEPGEISNAKRLLKYWHTIFKIKRDVWILNTINPFRASLLLSSRPQIILADISTLKDKLPSINNGQEHQLAIQVGQQLSPAKLSQQLVSFDYDFSTHASETGYFARRGGVMDIFPVNVDSPLRLDWQDNSINKIQTFNPVNKRVQEDLGQITIIAKQFNARNGQVPFSSYFDAVNDPIIIHQDINESSSIPLGWSQFDKKLAKHQRIIFRNFDQSVNNLSFEPSPLFHRDYDKLARELKDYTKRGWQIKLVTQKKKEIQDLITSKEIPDTSIIYWPYENSLSGFKNKKGKILILSDHDIFGENQDMQSPRKRVDQAFIMELKPGDYVVHLDHGIGKFTTMAKNVVESITKEYFILEYAEKDRLYVPVETADKLSKYIGLSHPKLHRLSGGQWYQLTRKVKQEAKVLAQELLRVYAKREMTKIKAFGKETAEEIALANSFPYQETADQARAIADVKSDLEQETPMDRLICGDVGFGKTEVAVRAALKAVMNKTQVALLSPTTILTQQHFDTFQERLKNLNVQVGILSRFESDKEQKDTIVKLKSGLCDIVIGTHRLLSPDVNFKRLGLIIIDEEQRFGVKAKEKLKSLRTQSHVLTLTATPIPRTLNIALSGVRNVSIIETPPEGRLPIETHIEPYSEETVQKEIKRELKRNGQVYYLHNKVETIAFAAKELQKLVPQAKFGIAHGRLPEKDLAKAMRDFDTKKTNILVCSTIIENGLDLPNVNTLIVDNATNFGLAQLYQLRGRIGRGNRQAYAYFFYHRKKLKDNAKKRLHALLEAKKLGSGFQLALRDLEIRGAGNILGKEQHGQVSAIGLSLYTRLLSQAIEELKLGKIQEPIRDILIDIPIESYIPKEFLPEEERLLLYQKMAGIMNLDELLELKDTMIRSRTREEQKNFPGQLLNLFAILEIRIIAQKTDISHVDTTLITDDQGLKKRRLLIKFLFPLQPAQLAHLLQKNPAWAFTDDSIKIDLDKLGDNWLEEIKKVIRLFKRQN